MDGCFARPKYGVAGPPSGAPRPGASRPSVGAVVPAVTQVPTIEQLSLLEPRRPTWEPDQPRDLDQAAVLQQLRDGRRHSRQELTSACLLHDREVRAAIEALRRAGWPIVSSSSDRGYLLTWNGDALDALERDLGSRALAALKTRSAIRRARRRRGVAA
jgi:biotin operon repressor